MAANTYETVFIAEPEIAADNVEGIVGKLKQIISTNQGTITAEDRWGRRRLAYPIQAHREGFYVVLAYTAEPAVVLQVEHLFNVTDTVIRYLTTRVIKSKKVFAPRRERPAGASDASRSNSSSRSGPSRPRTDAPRPASAPAAAAPAATPVAAATPVSAVPETPAAAPTPEGGTPA